MVLPTRIKLQIARLLNRVIVGMRALAGLPPQTRVRRNGAFWELDLDEGVELAIYLGLYQSLPQADLKSELSPGACVIDIGANIGAHTFALAQAVGSAGQVLAIEPTSYAFGKLKKNLELNPALAGRVMAVQCALNDGSADTGRAKQFYSRWPLKNADADFHAQHGGKYESSASARLVALDDLLRELRRSGRLQGAISFLKLDVDGHELDVLTGAQSLLRDERPTILMEVAPHIQDEVPGRFEALVGLLHRFGYRFEAMAGKKRLPDTASGLRELIPYGASIDALIRPIG